MEIYNDIYVWKGWGGHLQLGSGKCWLRIYDLTKDRSEGFSHLRPIIVIVSDLVESKMTIRSCAGHIATTVTAKFNIDPQRMLWVEHYPPREYGQPEKHIIPERFEAVDFTWYENKALKPRWRPLHPPILDVIKAL